MASVFFSGTISGWLLSVGRMREGDKIAVGSQLFGCGVADGTRICRQFSGAKGGPGVYWVEPQQTVSSATLEARSSSRTEMALPIVFSSLEPLRNEVDAMDENHPIYKAICVADVSGGDYLGGDAMMREHAARAFEAKCQRDEAITRMLLEHWVSELEPALVFDRRGSIIGLTPAESPIGCRPTVFWPKGIPR